MEKFFDIITDFKVDSSTKTEIMLTRRLKEVFGVVYSPILLNKFITRSEMLIDSIIFFVKRLKYPCIREIFNLLLFIQKTGECQFLEYDLYVSESEVLFKNDIEKYDGVIIYVSAILMRDYYITKEDVDALQLELFDRYIATIEDGVKDKMAKKNGSET